MFKAVLIVPLYNHLPAFRRFAPSLKETRIPVLVIDDGSSDGDAVQAFCTEMGFLYRRHPTNRGKGAALRTGLREARVLGFTHALQIDADGQHVAADVIPFLEEAYVHQEALINGFPFYDQTAPRKRVKGREITNFWVVRETHYRFFGDAMCGFRVYPLRLVEPFLKDLKADGMGGDIEILVHAIWHKIQIIPKMTRVTYPPDGVSHFRMVRDNWALTCLHARLFFTALRRKPWKRR